jgi:imidazoleglycerol-phosphate dehydratase
LQRLKKSVNNTNNIYRIPDIKIEEVIIMVERKATVTRETQETSIKVDLNIDGQSRHEISTGLRFFDHMLCQLAQHGIFDIKLAATGSDQHHIIEDTALTLGKAFNEALGDRQGIIRMAHAFVPMDDALAMVALDISGRGYSAVETSFSHANIADMPTDLIRHFIITFASETKINIHAKILNGINDHHKAEALFKALARALDNATRIDARIPDILPSTKKSIER